MELYTAGTGNGQRAAIAVNECGVACQIHVLNLGQGDQKAADYLKINPTGRIPTLIDPEGPGGKPLTVTQSWAILMYLCEKTDKFLPVDPAARIQMFQWMAEGAADYASVNQTIFFSRRADAGKGAGFGDQVLRGPLRQSVALCRRAACQDAISSRRRNHRRRSGGLPNLCRPQGSPRQCRSEASASLGRADWSAARRAEGHEARKLTADREDRQGRVYRAPSQAGPGNDINAGSPGFQKARTRGPASQVAARALAGRCPARDTAIVGHGNFAIEQILRACPAHAEARLIWTALLGSARPPRSGSIVGRC